MKHILIVDDEFGSREALKAVFSASHEVSTAEGAERAQEILRQKKTDLLLLDIMMPQKDGLAFLEDVRSLYPALPVVMVTALDAPKHIIQAMRVGAYDYLTKPFDVEEVRHVVARALRSATLERRVETLEGDVAREFPVDGIVGDSAAFKKALEHLRKAARTDSTVLIRGESGTGKELAARLLHALSNRRDEPFVPVHCGALPESLMESELFGYEKGAFTNAVKQKPGRFDLAGSGTLFFDEVSEMSAATQVKLLRVLQEREFMRVGGTRIIRTNARIVAASAKDLKEEAQNGRFRDDLYYRLSVVPVFLPPLRERPEDIPVLARYFLSYFKQTIDVQAEGFDPETLATLSAYPWPGNVREMRNVVERMLVLHGRQGLLGPESLPEEFHTSPPSPASTETAEGGGGTGGTLQDRVNAFERGIIVQALKEAGGIQTRAAELLGTTRRILAYRMEKLQIPAHPSAG